MSKVIYNVLMRDKATDEVDILIACHSEEQAQMFIDLYILENYGKPLDLEAAGVGLTIEPTFLQADKIYLEDGVFHQKFVNESIMV